MADDVLARLRDAAYEMRLGGDHDGPCRHVVCHAHARAFEERWARLEAVLRELDGAET